VVRDWSWSSTEVQNCTYRIAS